MRQFTRVSFEVPVLIPPIYDFPSLLVPEVSIDCMVPYNELFSALLYPCVYQYLPRRVKLAKPIIII